MSRAVAVAAAIAPSLSDGEDGSEDYDEEGSEDYDDLGDEGVDGEEEAAQSSATDEEGETSRRRRIDFVTSKLRGNSKSKELSKVLSESMPLYHFKPQSQAHAKTIWGHVIPTFSNSFGADENKVGEPIHDPMRSARLSVWFVARAHKELLSRQMESRSTAVKEGVVVKLADTVVFESSGLFDAEPLGAGGAVKEEALRQGHLHFDSSFESGNLEKAVRVSGRNALMTQRALDHLRDYAVPGFVDQEYDLTARTDLNTLGNIQWFYFSATAPEPSAENKVRYPLRVRFNVVNMEKKDSLYNYGMKPAVLRSGGAGAGGWSHSGDDVCYFKNGKTITKPPKTPQGPKRLQHLHSLAFTYVFQQPGTVSFAHCYPYTYSDLQRYLLSLEQDERIAQFTKRSLLCKTIAGNRCDLLTITARAADVNEQKQRPAIVVSARVHPGESNSSFVCHGFLEFITADTKEAELLRSCFVFKIVPMLNPDGVIHGNYRCSLVGTDLNRRYGDVNPHLHPTVHAMKHLLQTTQRQRGVLLYLDLHGHSKKKNAFLYGCDVTQQPQQPSQSSNAVWASGSGPPARDASAQRIFTRVFPTILCALNREDQGGAGYFSYSDCTFSVSKDKQGTGRVVSWRTLGVEATYTVEVSFCCGNGDNRERKIMAAGSKAITRARVSAAASGCVSPNSSAAASSKVGGEGGGGEDDDECEEGEVTEEVLILQQAVRSPGSGPASSSSSSSSSSSAQPPPPASLARDALDALKKVHASQRHYSKTDLRNMGRDLCLALLYSSNVNETTFSPQPFYSILSTSASASASAPALDKGVAGERGAGAESAPEALAGLTMASLAASLPPAPAPDDDPVAITADSKGQGQGESACDNGGDREKSNEQQGPATPVPNPQPTPKRRRRGGKKGSKTAAADPASASDPPPSSSKQQRRRQRNSIGPASSNDAASGTDGPIGFAGFGFGFGGNACSQGIVTLPPRSLSARFLQPSVLSLAAINQALAGSQAPDINDTTNASSSSMSSLPSFGSTGPRYPPPLSSAPLPFAPLGLVPRVCAELSVRRLLNLVEGLAVPSSLAALELAEQLQPEAEAEDSGSDSDPSVDNVKMEAPVAGKRRDRLDWDKIRASIRDATRSTLQRSKSESESLSSLADPGNKPPEPKKVVEVSARLQQRRRELPSKNVARDAPSATQRTPLPQKHMSTITLEAGFGDGYGPAGSAGGWALSRPAPARPGVLQRRQSFSGAAPQPRVGVVTPLLQLKTDVDKALMGMSDNARPPRASAKPTATPAPAPAPAPATIDHGDRVSRIQSAPNSRGVRDVRDLIEHGAHLLAAGVSPDAIEAAARRR